MVEQAKEKEKNIKKGTDLTNIMAFIGIAHRTDFKCCVVVII